MKIAFVGASGYGNTGDDTYPLVFQEHLPEHQLLFYNSNLPDTLPSDIELLVLGGGGILHNVGNGSDSDESPHFKCMRFYMDWAIKQGVPWGFISCGFQFRPHGESTYRESLEPWVGYMQAAHFITLRSPRCVQIASELTGRTNLDFFPDAAYLFKPDVDTKEDILTLVPAGAVNPSDRMVQHLIRLFCSMDYKIVWQSMGSKKDDLPNLEEAKRKYPSSIVEFSTTPMSAYRAISRSRMVISGRYHGMVFSRTCRVPFLVPENAPFKLVHENYERPMADAYQHLAVLRSFCNPRE